MLRHWVNFGLLFSFLTLAVSGLLAYLQPFSIVTTRVHVVFGLLTFVLVGLHLASRIPYFKAQTVGRKASYPLLIVITASWVVLLVVSLQGVWPAKPLMEGSYESRHKRAIVRPSPLAGLAELDGGQRLVARKPGEGADTMVSLLLRFGDQVEGPPALAVWAETTNGSMIETLYLPSELAYSEDVTWKGAETKRHHLLPIWRHKHTLVTGVDPEGEIDAYTAATPEHAFTLDQYLNSGEDGRFVICVEVNALGDANEAYDDEVLGQPSLLYTAYVDASEGPKYGLLELTAHGGEAIESGTLNYDFEGIDSARQLIDLLLVHTEKFER
ncbi:MAG: hypothetical protein R3242_04995 [Akkermansiaceae bacterium]|nr:hypothetical protein [Akkermansiaceae bacterium]